MATGFYFRARKLFHHLGSWLRLLRARVCAHPFDRAARLMTPWLYRMVAGSHRIYAKLWDHSSGGWERILRPLFVSHGVFSLFGACPAVIRDKASFSVLALLCFWLSARPNRAIPSKRRLILCNRLHRVSTRMHLEGRRDQILHVCARRSIFTTTMFWRFSLSNADDSFVMWGKKGRLSPASAPSGFIARVNAILNAFTWYLHAHNMRFTHVRYCTHPRQGLV